MIPPNTDILYEVSIAQNGAKTIEIEKIKKTEKKVLTKGKGSGNLIKLSGESVSDRADGTEKFEKNRKKFLTNQSGCVKLKKLLNGIENVESPEKNLKKVLDKRKTMC